MKQSKINNYIKRSILCIVFVAIVAVLLYLSARLVEHKDSEEKNGTFFTEAAAGHIDALFLGSSHVVNGFNSSQIYEETGYTIYNLGGHGSILPVSYWTLVNALDYCTPQVVFIDTYFIDRDYHYLDSNEEGDYHETETAVNQLHEVFDCFPETANKRAAIADLISDEETRLEFSVDFIKYHSRWSSLTETDYRKMLDRENTSHMGSQLRYETSTEVYDYPLIAPNEMDETDTVGKQYLRKIVELCISRGIRPVIVQLPFAADAGYQQKANSVQLIADEYGIPFVNLQYAENIINYAGDLQSQTHLSAYGAYKVSHYLAQNTLQELGLTDHRGEPGYASWESSAEEWHEEIRNVSKWTQELSSLLMIMQFDDLRGKVLVRSDSTLFRNPLLAAEVRELINNAKNVEVIMVDPGSEHLFGEDHLKDDIQLEIYNKADGSLLAHRDFTL